MKEENSPSAVVSETSSPEASHSSTEESVQRHWQGVVKRRSFLKGLGIAGATLSAGALLGLRATHRPHGAQASFLKATQPSCGSRRQ